MTTTLEVASTTLDRRFFGSRPGLKPITLVLASEGAERPSGGR